MGGWPPNTLAADVLDKANAMARDLKLEVSLQDAFVPGVRKGFVLMPLKPRADETEEEMRQKAEACIRRVSQAGVDLGPKPDGNRAKLWLAVSQPPEKRRRAALAGKVKRLIIEAGGGLHRRPDRARLGHRNCVVQRAPSGLSHYHAAAGGHRSRMWEQKDYPGVQFNGAMWQVANGDCTIDEEGCIQSPGFPEGYGNSEACEIAVDVPSAVPIRIMNFSTEQGFDRLVIDCEAFSGTSGPDGVIPTSALSWSTDESTGRTLERFKLNHSKHDVGRCFGYSWKEVLQTKIEDMTSRYEELKARNEMQHEEKEALREKHVQERLQKFSALLGQVLGQCFGAWKDTLEEGSERDSRVEG
eukprot:s3949_g1.t1